jgi:hypothetical protein
MSELTREPDSTGGKSKKKANNEISSHTTSFYSIPSDFIDSNKTLKI